MFCCGCCCYCRLVHREHTYTQIENTHNNPGLDRQFQGLLCFFQTVISTSLNTRLFVVHRNVRLINGSMQFVFGSSQKQEGWNEARSVAVSRYLERLLTCYKSFYTSVCVCVSIGCLGVCMGMSTRSWMLIFTFKGAYCKFSLWHFFWYTVWMLSCQTGCSKACFIFFSWVCVPISHFSCQNYLLKRIISMAPFTGLWFWQISFQPN